MRKSPTFLSKLSLVFLAVLVLSAFQGLKAQTLYNFTPVSGTVDWSTSANWTSSLVPNTSGTLVNLEADLNSAAGVTVNIPTGFATVGSLFLGDVSGNTGPYIIQSTGSGVLTFDGGNVGRALLQNFLSNGGNTVTAFSTISAPIQINGILDVNEGLNGNYMTILSGVINGGMINKIGGGALKITGTYTPGVGSPGVVVNMRGFGDAGTITNATQNSNLLLDNTSGTSNAINGNLTVGNASRGGTGSAVVTLDASEQIANTAVITFDGVSGSNPYFKLSGFTETVAGISNYDSNGVLENSENEAISSTGTLIFDSANATDFYSYNGYIRDLNTVGTGHVAVTMAGAGIQVLSGGNIKYTGATTISNGTLRLVQTTAFNSHITVGVLGTLELQATGTWNFGPSAAAPTATGFDITGGGSLILSGTSNLNLNVNVTLGGNLTILPNLSANNTFTLSGTNTFGGGFSVAVPVPPVPTNSNPTNVIFAAGGSDSFTGGFSVSGPYVFVDMQTAVGITGAMLINRAKVTLEANANVAIGAPASITLTGTPLDTIFTINNGAGAANNNNRVGDTTPWISNGGKIVFGGDTSQAHSEALGSLTLTSGDLEISTSTISAGSTLSFTGLTSRAVGSTITSTVGIGAATNKVTFGGLANTNNIIGGWATVSSAAGLEFATYGANGVAALGSYSALASGTTTTNNVKLVSGSISAATTINSLNIQNTSATPGTVTLTNGILTITSGGLLVDGTTTLTNGLNSQINATGTGALTVGPAPGGVYELVATVGSGQILNITAPIANNAGNAVSLTKSGLGFLLLSGASTYTGNIYINQGILDVSTESNGVTGSSLGIAPGTTGTGKGGIFLNGGELELGSGVNLNANRGITVGAQGGSMTAIGTSTYAGIINATGTFTYILNPQTGTSANSVGNAGTLTLSGNNNFAGGLETGASLGVTGALTSVSGADTSVLNLTGSNLISRIRLNGSTVNLTGAGAGNTISGDIVIANGNLVLAGINTLTNPNGTTITMQAGTITLGSATALGSATSSGAVAPTGLTAGLTLTGTSGKFSLNGFNLMVNTLNGSGFFTIDNGASTSAATLTINQVANTSFTGVITDAFDAALNPTGGVVNFTKTGSGNLTMSLTLGANAFNSYNGVTTIAGGTLTVFSLSGGGSSSSIGSSSNAAANLVLIGGGALTYGGSFESFTDRSFTLGAGQDAGSIIADGSTRAAILHFGNDQGGPASPNVAFTGSGARTLTLGGFNQGDNSFNLVLNDAAGLNAFTSLNKIGNGTWLLTQNNGYTGLTTISGGVLAVTVNGALGSTTNGTILEGGASTQSFSVGGVLDFRNVNYTSLETIFMEGGEVGATVGSSTFAGPLIASVPSNFQISAGAQLTLTGTIKGVAALTLLGEGTLVLSGDSSGRNSSLAAFTVQAGTLVLNYNSADGGTLTRKLGTPTATTGATLVLGGSRLGGEIKVDDGTGTLTLAQVNTTGSNLAYSELASGLSLAAGENRITNTATTAASDTNPNLNLYPTVVLVLNKITPAAGATLNFAESNLATTTSPNLGVGRILGAWATVGDSDWAIVDDSFTYGFNYNNVGGSGGSFITSLSTRGGGYTSNAWGTQGGDGTGKNNVTVTQNTLVQNLATASTLRYNDPSSLTETLQGTRNVISSGGILITPNVGAHDDYLVGSVLAAGTNTTGAFPNQDFIIYQNNIQGKFVIGSVMQNNQLGGTSGLNKLGQGSLVLTGLNTYTGVTTLSDGVLSFNHIGPTGFAASTGVVSTDTAGFATVFGSTLGLTVGQTLVAGAGFASNSLVIISIPDLYHYVLGTAVGGAPVAATSANTGTTFSFSATGPVGGVFSSGTSRGSDIVTVANVTGIIIGQSVSGAGIPEGAYVTGIIDSTHIILSTAATADITGDSLTYSNTATSLGSSTNGVANLVLNGATLQYTGGTAVTDRAFTVNFDAKISVTDPNTILTMTGVVTTASPNGDYPITKLGEGTLRFTDSTFTSSNYGITGYVADQGRLQLVLAFANDRYARNDVGTLTVGGGTFELIGDTIASRSQNLPGQFTVNMGQSQVEVTSQLGVTTTLFLQNANGPAVIAPAVGGTVQFVENTNLGVSGIVLNTVALGESIPLPWAVYKDTTVNNDTTSGGVPGFNDFAAIDAATGNVGFVPNGIFNSAINDASTWGSQDSDSPYISEGSQSFSGTITADTHVALLRYLNPGDSTLPLSASNTGTSLVTISNGVTLTLDQGAILLTAIVGHHDKTISGGNLTSGYPGELIIQNYNYSAPFHLNTNIVDGSSLQQAQGFNGTNQLVVFFPDQYHIGESVTGTVDGASLPPGTVITSIDLVNFKIGINYVIPGSPTDTINSTFYVLSSPNPIAFVQAGQSVTKTIDQIVLTNLVGLSGTIANQTNLLTVDTSGLSVGMTVTGNGVPAGTTILAINSGVVTLSAKVTAASAGNGFSFFSFGSASSTFAGVGTTILSGNDTYTGATIVTGGVLRLESTNAVPGGIAALGGTSHIIIDGGQIGLGSGSGDFLRALGTGAAQVEFAGSGGFAAYGVDRNVNFGGNGTPTALRWGFNSFLNDDSILILGAPDADHTISLLNPIDLGPINHVVRTDNGTASVDAVLKGALSGNGGALVKTGYGTLRLDGVNTYTGGTIVGSGNLMSNNPNTAFGTGVIGLGTTSDSDLDDNVALTLGGIGVASNNIANAITVGTANSTGITTINSVGAPSTSTPVVTGAITLNRNVFLNATVGNSLTFSGSVTGLGGITVIGGGDVILSGTNSYASNSSVISSLMNGGGTVVRSGTIHADAAAALGGTTVQLGDSTQRLVKTADRATNATSIMMLGGVFDATYDGTGGSHPNPPGGFLNVSTTVDGHVYVAANADSNTGAGDGLRILVKDDTGNPERNGIYRIVSVSVDGSTMDLVRDTDFAVGSMNYGVQVIVTNASSDGTPANTVYFMAASSVTSINQPDADPTAWLIDTSTSNVALVTDTAGIMIGNNISVNATNNGTSTIGGSATFTTGASSTFSGSIQLQDLIPGVIETKTLLLSSSLPTGDGVIFSGPITEAGAEDVLSIGRSGSATGIVTLSGTNGYHGVTNITVGAIRAENSLALGFGDGGAADGTVVSANAELQIAGNITIGNEALTLNGGGFTGGGALHNISGTNSYGGAILLATSATIAADAGSQLTLTKAISGASTSTLTTGGAGTVSLGAASTYDGATIVSSGVLQVLNSNALGSAVNGTTVNATAELQLVGTSGDINITTEALALNGGTLHSVTGTNTYGGTINLQTSSTVSADSASPLTLSNVISGSGALNKGGLGVVILTNANNTYGATNINAGTLQVGVGGTGSTSTGLVTVNTGGTLAGSGTVKGSTSVLSGGVISPGDHGGTDVGTTLHINGNLTMADGSAGNFNVARILGTATSDKIVLSGTSLLTLNHSVFTVTFDSGFTPLNNEVIDLLDWSTTFSGTFDPGSTTTRAGGSLGDLILPNLAGVTYDVSKFKMDGTIGFIVAVPEPSRILLLASGLMALLMRRRRRNWI